MKVALRLVLLAASAAAAHAQLQETIVTNQLNSPVAMAVAPDGRVFVAQQSGELMVVQNGALLPQPFLVAPTLADDEEGLIGVAIDPQFATNGWIYVHYTTTTPTRHQRISRFTAAGNVAAPNSELVLIDLDDNFAHFHVSSGMTFGSDGMLYFGSGDSASPPSVPQMNSTRGKLFRIAPDGTIPASNPFFATTTGVHRAIYAIGVRNPFSIATNRSGRIWFGDIGSNTWEEVDELVAGANYGYPVHEGIVNVPGLDDPVFSYMHSFGVCAITGSLFYEPAIAHFPSLQGKFLFTEYCAGEIRSLDVPVPGTAQTVHTCSVQGPVALGLAPDGSLYYLARGHAMISGGPVFPGGTLVHVTCPGCQMQASAVAYGAGCAGQPGVPALAASALPRPGTSNLTLDVTTVVPGNGVFLLLGRSSTNSLLGPLPIDLGVIGMPTCFLHTSGDTALLAIASATGTASYAVGIPNNAALLGARGFFQAFASDPSANQAGIVGSNGIALTVGS